MPDALPALAPLASAPLATLALSTGDLIVAAIMLGVVCFVLLVVGGSFVSLWMQARGAGVRVGLGELIGMRLRKVDPRPVIFSAIRLQYAGVPTDVRTLETHVLAGGKLPNVVSAMITAIGEGEKPVFMEYAAIDLAGEDVLAMTRERLGLESEAAAQRET